MVPQIPFKTIIDFARMLLSGGVGLTIPQTMDRMSPATGMLIMTRYFIVVVRFIPLFPGDGIGLKTGAE